MAKEKSWLKRVLSTLWGKIAGLGILFALVAILSFIADVLQIFSNEYFQNFIRIKVIIPLWLYLLIGLFSIVWVLHNSRKISPNITGTISLHSDGVFLETFERRLDDATDSVKVCLVGKDWVFPLILTTTFARMRGIDITVLHDAASPHERFNLLKNLGCTVRAIKANLNQLPFFFVVIDPNNSVHGSALVYSIKPKDGVHSMQHVCPHDYYVIKACDNAIKPFLNNLHNNNQFTPTITKVDHKILVKKLKEVRFYRNADISLIDVKIKDVKPISSVIETHKLQQAIRLIDFFNMNAWSLFEPAAILLANNNQSFIVPPVIEEYKNNLVIAEGHTRLYALKNHGIEYVKAFVIKNINTPPAADPKSWKKIIVQSDKRTIDNPDLARRIETTLHQNVWT